METMIPEEIRIQQSSENTHWTEEQNYHLHIQGFSQYNLFMENGQGTSNNFGVFPTGSTVAQQLNPIEFEIKFFLNIEKNKT